MVLTMMTRGEQRAESRFGATIATSDDGPKTEEEEEGYHKVISDDSNDINGGNDNNDDIDSYHHAEIVAEMGDDAHELPEIIDRSSLANFGTTGRAVSIIAPSELHGASDTSMEAAAGEEGGFDVCKEYGYKYEYTEEDDDEHGDGGGNDDGYDDPLYGGGGGTASSHVSASPFPPSSAAAASSSRSNHGGRPYSRPMPNWSQKINQRQSNNADNDNQDEASQFGGTTYLLGRRYHPLHDHPTRRDDESSLMWFTYRSSFPCIEPYNITSDAGWGCMLRSAQMLMCQALRVHHCGRDWRPPRSFRERREGGCYVRDALNWFADFPSVGGGLAGAEYGAEEDGCWYSLHNMVAAGLARYEMLPGEWYGPGTACHVLRDLAELHARAVNEGEDGEDEGRQQQEEGQQQRQEGRRQEQQGGEEEEDDDDDGLVEVRRPMLRVHVAHEGCVYRSEVRELMTRDGRKDHLRRAGESSRSSGDGGNGSSSAAASTSSSSPPSRASKAAAAATMKDPLLNPLGGASPDRIKSSEQPDDLDWDTSLLLLIPLRLGLRSFDADSYRLPLAHTFALRQSVGFLGGTPRHALWFYGASEDGSKIYGLDPHTVQAAPERCREGGRRGVALLSDSYLRSVHCTAPSTMEMSRIDPSLALAFYCRDRADFDDLCGALDDMKAEGARCGGGAVDGRSGRRNGKIPELFGVADAAPDYCANVSSAMVEMMMSSTATAAAAAAGNASSGRVGSALMDDVCAYDDEDGGGSDSDDEEYVML